MGYQPMIVNTLFLAILAKKAQFYEKSLKLIFWYKFESLLNQNVNIRNFSIFRCVQNFENMPDNL